MKYDIELVNCNGHQLQAVKKLREMLGCDLSLAKHYVENTPCIILEGVDDNTANGIITAFHEIGVEVNSIDRNGSSYCPEITTPQSINQSNTYHNNERDILINLWCGYNEYNNAVNISNDQIRQKKKEIKELENTVNKMQKEIDDNKRIKATNGECLRPKIHRVSLIELPDFDIVKWIFVALTIISFIVMLVMVAITPETIENLALTLNVPAGMLVWLGAPVIGVLGTVIFLVIFVIKFAIDNQAINNSIVRKNRTFDVTKAKNEAIKFLDNIESYLAEKSEKENAISNLKSEINELESYKRNLPAVENNIPMPNELRSADGVALLIQYIDTGRAYTLQEAINLYYQDLKDSKRMEELRKQTQYAQEQMMNSRIAAENSRIAAENARRTLEATNRAADAAERAADAASEAADYERRSYFDNLYRQNSKK